MRASLAILGLLPLAAAAAQHRHQVRARPRFPYDPSTSKYCTFWYDNDDGAIRCEDMPVQWFITVEEWERWNPSVAESCDNFVVGKSYCIEVEGEPPVTSSAVPTSTSSTSTTTTTTTTATTTTTTKPDNGIATPTPTRPGMADNCDAFYKVREGDTCAAIAKQHFISVSQFATWNPSAGGTSSCTGLWIDTYVCVSVIGHEPTPTATKPDNGIATPTPFQPGMVDDCDRFYKVVRGDGCASIAAKHEIEVDEFVRWNPEVGGQACSGLWLDTYVCVRVVGYKPVPKTQPGIADPCSELYKAISADTCEKIVGKYDDLSLADFYKWNPDCTGLWAGYSYCVGIPAAFSVKALYHADCTSPLHRQATLARGGGMCLDTDCQVASLDISAAVGDCPADQVQISYWEQTGCP